MQPGVLFFFLMMSSDRSRDTRQELELKRFSLNIRKHLFYWWWLAFGICCTERLCSFPRWRYSKDVWAQCSASYATWLCLTRDVGLDDLLRCLPTSSIVIPWLQELKWSNVHKLWLQGLKWGIRMTFPSGGHCNKLSYLEVVDFLS